MKKTSMAYTLPIIMSITLTGKVMGILRDRLQAVYFGTYSAEAIAFSQAAFLPRNFLDIMFASVFSASFIPVFNRELETLGKDAAFALAARFIRFLLLVTTAVTVLAVIFAEPVYGVFLAAEAHAAEVRPLAVTLLRIMFPIMVVSSLAFSLTGILQSMGQFYIPAAMSIASNGVILLYYFFGIERFGVYGLAVAFLVGWGAQVVIQLPFLVRNGFFLRPWGAAPHPARDSSLDPFKSILKLSLPVMVASWLLPVNLLVNTRAVGGLYGGEHGFPALMYAHSLYTVITGLFVLSLANVLFPALSKFAAVEDWAGYTEYLRTCLRGMLFLLLPMTFGLMAVAEPLVRLVFYGGRFDGVSVQITATALFFFSLGIVGFGLQVILSRACFALQDGRGPLVTAVLAMVINAVLSFALAPSMEIGGPALASAVGISVAGVGLLIRLRGLLPERLWDSRMIFDIGKMLALALVMYAVVSLIDGIFLAAAAGVVLYLLGAFILKIPEVTLWIKR